MKAKETLIGLLCASLIGLNAGKLSANPGISTKKPPVFGTFSYIYPEAGNYIELDDKNSLFSLRIVDGNKDNEAGLIRLLDESHDMTFRRHDFTLKDTMREVQLFNMADRFLEYFSKPKKESNEQVYENYMKIIKDRFLEKKNVKPKSTGFDFGKFLSFEPEDSIEDLIVSTFFRYNRLVKEVKALSPEQTFQSIMEGAGIIDKLKLWWLFYNDYGKNLSKLGYGFENFSFNGDYVEISVLDKKKKEGDMPYIKMEINTDSLPDALDINEIRNFLNGKDSTFFKYDKAGNYLYGGFRADKKS